VVFMMNNACLQKLLFLHMKYFKQVEIGKSAWIGDLTDHRLVASSLPLMALSKHELPFTYFCVYMHEHRAKLEEGSGS